MPDYDLSGLTPRSFEKLVQALASKILGPGIVVFGDGPDGGREATFEGRLPFPSDTQPWEGYCVVQAKFLQRPRSPRQDGAWALQQLRKELAAYGDLGRGRRNPDYYIFATNVVLTPAKSGAKDKLDQLLRKYRKSVPINDWRLWDFDQICTFLDANGDIRRAYGAWITPGDVLAQVIGSQDSTGPAFLDVMANFLAKELRADQFAKLEQAGHSADQRISLASVFVDLPTSRERLLEPPNDRSAAEACRDFAKEILDVARERLDPSSTAVQHDQELAREARPAPGRYVLIGGPGQGKSTLGQFICQLFRASLLQTRPSHLLPPEVREALDAIGNQCLSERLEIPKARRFPVRIVLSEFADAVRHAHQDKPLSLLVYIVQLIRRRADQDLTADDLRRWLVAYPWLIVLDGLDEVPASSNRDEVLTKVEEFWIDAIQGNADVLVIATTRPQGYNDDFSPRHYQHVWLVPLSPARAMHYARRLAGVKYRHDSDRSSKVVSRLEQAAKHEATARLMRSPLQITIMATLVDQIGQPPQDRWRLFHEYYQVIYRREMERGIPAADLLRSYRKEIDIIHCRAALLLQVESECSGGAEARLSKERFATLVESRLIEEEIPDKDRGHLTKQIIEAVAERLVFLVAPQADQVGFEIRSLQEFMAAEALMQGPDGDVQSRLREIAPISSWRNVFLFAAGRCFGEAQHLRDTIYAICAELNDGSVNPILRTVRAGSVLALDLLEDGVVHRQPKYGRLLLSCALQVLDLPPVQTHVRLADSCEVGLEEVVREELQRRLSATNDAERLAGWATLLALVSRGIAWARALADERWEHETSLRREIAELPAAGKAEEWLLPRLEVLIPQQGPYWLPPVGYRLERGRVEQLEKSHPWLMVLRRAVEYPTVRGSTFPLRLPSLKMVNAGLRIALLRGPWAVELPDLRGTASAAEWAPILEGIVFAQQPSKDTLSAALERIAERTHDIKRRRWTIDCLPWVIAACLQACEDSSQLHILAARAAAGELGDREDWLTAEERWQRVGITPEDIRAMADFEWPFTRGIREVGFPFAAAWISWTQGQGHSFSTALYELYKQLDSYFRLRAEVAGWLLSTLTHETLDSASRRIPAWVTPRVLDELTENLDSWIYLDLLGLAATLARDRKLDSGWMRFLDKIGRSETTWQPWHRRGIDYADVADKVAQALKKEPGCLGLLWIWARLLLLGARPRAVQPYALPREGLDSRSRLASIMIEIATGALTEQRAQGLAFESKELARKYTSALSDICQMIVMQELFVEATDRYLLALHEMIGHDEWQELGLVITCLNDSLRHRRSNLEDPAIWAKLRLPEGLLSFFSH